MCYNLCFKSMSIIEIPTFPQMWPRKWSGIQDPPISGSEKGTSNAANGETVSFLRTIVNKSEYVGKCPPRGKALDATIPGPLRGPGNVGPVNGGGHAVDTRWTRGGHEVDTRWARGGHAVGTRWARGGHAVGTQWARSGQAEVDQAL